MEKTEEFIREHQHKVQQNIYKLCKVLLRRAENHDKSKLQEPEKSGWEAMDKEPRYPYGSDEYFDKQERFKWVFEEHWKNNRHHPEYFCGFISEMNLIDIIEMICDWASFDYMTSTDAIEIIEEQMERFGFSGVLKDLILNTYSRYFVISDDEKQEKQMIDYLNINPNNIDFKALERNFLTK